MNDYEIYPDNFKGYDFILMHCQWQKPHWWNGYVLIPKNHVLSSTRNTHSLQQTRSNLSNLYKKVCIDFYGPLKAEIYPAFNKKDVMGFSLDRVKDLNSPIEAIKHCKAIINKLKALENWKE